MSENQSPLEEAEYIGNIWGWKVSLLSLAFIVLMLLFVWYRYSLLPDEPTTPSNNVPVDTIGTIVE